MKNILLTLGLLTFSVLPMQAANKNASASVQVAPSTATDVKSAADRKAALSNGPQRGRELTYEEANRILKILQGPVAGVRAALDRGEFTVDDICCQYTPLIYALAHGGSLETAALLVERGAEPNKPMTSGYTPSMSVMCMRPLLAKAARLRFLYQIGTNIAAGMSRGTDALGIQINQVNFDSFEKRYIPVLVALGCDPNRATREAGTPLCYAMESYDPSFYGIDRCAIAELVACGADIREVESYIEPAKRNRAWTRAKDSFEPLVRAQLRKGWRLLKLKQLPLLQQQLKETFLGSSYERPFGEFASIINAYAGPLVLPPREYTHAEKTAMLDRLVALAEYEAAKPQRNANRLLVKAMKRFKAKKAKTAGAKPA